MDGGSQNREVSDVVLKVIRSKIDAGRRLARGHLGELLALARGPLEVAATLNHNQLALESEAIHSGIGRTLRLASSSLNRLEAAASSR